MSGEGLPLLPNGYGYCCGYMLTSAKEVTRVYLSAKKQETDNSILLFIFYLFLFFWRNSWLPYLGHELLGREVCGLYWCSRCFHHNASPIRIPVLFLDFVTMYLGIITTLLRFSNRVWDVRRCRPEVTCNWDADLVIGLRVEAGTTEWHLAEMRVSWLDYCCQWYKLFKMNTSPLCLLTYEDHCAYFKYISFMLLL